MERRPIIQIPNVLIRVWFRPTRTCKQATWADVNLADLHIYKGRKSVWKIEKIKTGEAI